MTQKEFEDRIGEKFVGDYSEVEECCMNTEISAEPRKPTLICI